MEHIADVTQIFWKFVAAIVHMDYDRLQKTRFFDIMHQCVVREQGFILDVGNVHFVHKDVNALFYDTYEYLRAIPGYDDSARLLKMAIDKIETVIAQNELMSSICTMTIESADANDITELDSLLAQLVIV
jgi:hypothetical protein